MIVVDGATATLLVGAGIPLGTVAGTITLDESAAPYAQATVTIARPDAATLDELDPRGTVPRVELELVAAYPGSFLPTKTRVFNLGLRRRFRELTDGTVQLELAGDEQLLDDDRLLDDEPLSLHPYQDSLRGLVNAVLARIGAELEPAGAADVSVRTSADAMNLIPNPSIEFGADGITTTNVNADTNDTSWSLTGGRSLNLWGPSSADSYAALGGGPGGLRLGMTAGKRYVLSATGNVKIAQAGASARARVLTVIYRVGQSGYVFVDSPAVPNVVGAPARVSVAFTLPAGTTEAFVRVYHGATSGEIRWDGFRLSEHTGDPTDTGFFDGDTADTAVYDYFWTAAAHPTTSSRRALVDRPPAALLWQPGRSALEFLAPILQAAGLRLYCTEAREWYLVDGATYTAPGVVQLTQPGNLHRATETTDRDSGEWYDAALVRYRWRQPDGTTAERVDFHGAPGYSRVATFELEAPYPGPGRAAYKVKRAAGLGRTADVVALADLDARPTQILRLHLEDTPELLGVVRSVRFELEDGTMSLTSRGLVDLGPDAILAIPDEYSIVELPGTILALDPSSL